MEILIICLLIAGLLIGWAFLMRVEISAFLGRIFESTASQSADREARLMVSTVRIVSGHTMVTNPASFGKDARVERHSPETEGGIHKWTLDE